MVQYSCRSGLVHVTKGQSGAPVPADLNSIKYSWVFVEIPDGGMAIHSIVPRLFLQYQGFFNGIWDFETQLRLEFFEKALNGAPLS